MSNVKMERMLDDMVGWSVEVCLGLGANLGDPRAQLQDALNRLEASLSGAIASDLYRTEPVGYADQPDFLNMVVLGRTDLSVYALHSLVHRIEADIGRRPGGRNHPRLIDIDILSYGELVLVSEKLTIPHPRMRAREFVLAPLAEVAPGWRDPVTGRTSVELRSGLPDVHRIERIGPLAKGPGNGQDRPGNAQEES